MTARYPLFLANRPHDAGEDLVVTDKYSGEVFATVPLASPQVVEQAIAAAVEATRPLAALKSYQRRDVLLHCVARFEARREEFARTLQREAGKPIKDSRVEVERLIDTFRVAAEESTRLLGEVLPMDIGPRAAAYSGSWKPFPVGPCSFIAPFNFPLNLAAHKIAPALAVGCPFVLKPASLTPLGALMIGEVLAETDLPPGTFSILPTTRHNAEALTTDDRLKLLSFTGSPAVGWALKAKAGRKKVTLELGGNAACIVDETANIDDAVSRIIVGAFYQSGQSCIGVQRVLVHESIHDEIVSKLVEKTRALGVGDPALESTFVGPMITEAEAERLETWIAEATAGGARILCGGKRRAALLEPTWLAAVPKAARVRCKEAFGPVALIDPFASFEEALAEVNDSEFGLQAGVFTRDIYRAELAYETLEVGAVIIGDVPSFRVDHMPYGGVKASGLGREGIRWAMQDMTEPRLFLLRTPANS